MLKPSVHKYEWVVEEWINALRIEMFEISRVRIFEDCPESLEGSS